MCKFDQHQQSPNTSRESTSSTENCDVNIVLGHFFSQKSHLRDEPNAKSTLIHVPHICQRYQWDCGLACALMALHALSFQNFTLNTLQNFCATSSIWTIDLAHCLRLSGVTNHIFATTCIGANPRHANELFYANQMDQDVERVNRLFETAQSCGIQVIKYSFTEEQLLAIISSNRYLVIALVDKSVLVKQSESPSQYVGHYIVVHGYDCETREYIVQDPAIIIDSMESRSLRRRSVGTRLGVAELEAARKAYGTDEDLIFIPVG